MLLTFAYIGSVASMLFIFIGPSVFYLAPILGIIGVTSLGFSFVLLNAFLPLLMNNHPSESRLKSFNSASSTSLSQELEDFEPDDTDTHERSDPARVKESAMATLPPC
jgi:UMF1 family MFS transporter